MDCLEEVKKNEIYIFLDVDGVLNRECDWDENSHVLNDECVKSFNELIEILSGRYNSIKVVFTSWKNGFSRTGEHAPYLQEILDRTAHPALFYVDKLVDAQSHLNRAKPINEYVKAHAIKSDILILDDKVSLFAEKLISGILYLASAKKGLTHNDVEILKQHFLPKKKKGFFSFLKW